MQTFDLRVHRLGGSETVQFSVTRLVIAGWAGRNEKNVLHHIQELGALGIAPPSETPLFYPIANDALTSADRIEVVGPDTSGEVESVIFIGKDEIYVSVGSDHTDRKLEAVSVSQSKQICAKPIAIDAWPMSELRDHWDQLRLESYVGAEFLDLYQAGGISELRSPAELLDIFRQRGGEVSAGMVMFGGTIAVKGGIRPSNAIQLKLIDPVLGREIVHRYYITVLPVTG